MQPLNPFFRRVTRHQRGVNGANRNAGDPGRFDARLRYAVVHTSLVGTQGAAPLKNEGNLFVRRELDFFHAAIPWWVSVVLTLLLDDRIMQCIIRLRHNSLIFSDFSFVCFQGGRGSLYVYVALVACSGIPDIA